jgi:hypothetical protein
MASFLFARPLRRHPALPSSGSSEAPCPEIGKTGHQRTACGWDLVETHPPGLIAHNAFHSGVFSSLRPASILSALPSPEGIGVSDNSHHGARSDLLPSKDPRRQSEAGTAWVKARIGVLGGSFAFLWREPTKSPRKFRTVLGRYLFPFRRRQHPDRLLQRAECPLCGHPRLVWYSWIAVLLC